MAIHSGIRDDGIRFQIVPSTRKITVPQSHKIIGTVGSHNSEQITFQCPKTIDGHDVVNCSDHYVSWINADGTDGRYDITADKITADEENMYFTWVIDSGVTAASGYVKFAVHFEDKGADDALLYAWGTTECNECQILGTVKNTGSGGSVPVPDGYIKPNGTKEITQNGEYDVSAYKSANVDVFVPTLYGTTIQQNGTHKPAEGHAFNSVVVNVQPKLQEKVVNANGEVIADSGFYGMKKVTVDVQPTLQEKTATGNGEVLPDEGFAGLSKVTVAIPEDVPEYQNKTVTENGTYGADEGFDALASVTVDVPIPDGYVQPSGTLDITENGTHDVSEYANVEVNVEGADFEDVTELPTLVDNSKIYRIQKEAVTEAILAYGGEVNVVTDFTLVLVDELPESHTDMETVFVLKESGVGYIYYSGWYTVGQLLTMVQGITLTDKGFITDEELAKGGLVDGIYMHKQTVATFGMPNASLNNTIYEADKSGRWVRSDMQVLMDMIQGGNNTKVKEITVPHGCSSIRKYGFYSFDALRKVSLPNTVTSIDEYAFYYCASLEEINIPLSIEYIGHRAFDGCSSLVIELPDKDIDIRENAVCHGDWVEHGFYNGTHFLRAENNYVGNIAIKEGTKYIQSYGFEFAKTVTGITVPEGVVSIHQYAFTGPQITTLVLPESITHLGGAIVGAYQVITKVSVTLKAKTPPTKHGIAANNPFEAGYVGALYVPAESVDLYKAHSAYSNIADIIFPIEE